MRSVDPNDIRKWAANHRAAAAREREEARLHPLTPAQALAYVTSLIAFDQMQNGSPFDRYDPVTVREDEQMWDAWARLRTRWRSGI
jgi:hypothetical protein